MKREKYELTHLEIESFIDNFKYNMVAHFVRHGTLATVALILVNRHPDTGEKFFYPKPVLLSGEDQKTREAATVIARRGDADLVLLGAEKEESLRLTIIWQGKTYKEELSAIVRNEGGPPTLTPFVDGEIIFALDPATTKRGRQTPN